MSFGYFSLQGYQSGTPSGGRINLGPFSIPFGSANVVSEYELTAGTQVIPVPAGAAGVVVIPPIGAPPAGVTLKYKTVSGDSGIFSSTEYPSLHEFDTVNSEVPANIYLVASGNITVSVQFV